MAAVSDSFTAFNFQNGAIHVSPRNWGGRVQRQNWDCVPWPEPKSATGWQSVIATITTVLWPPLYCGSATDADLVDTLQNYTHSP